MPKVAKILLSIASLAGVVLAGCETEEQVAKDIARETPAFRVSSVQLWSEYEWNEIAADEKHKGKALLVTGAIHDFGRDILDTPYVVLTGGKFGGGVQCMFVERDTGSCPLYPKDRRSASRGVAMAS